MKPEKRKVKAADAKAAKRRASDVHRQEPEGPRWTDHEGLCHVSMQAGQSLLLTGQCVIQVLQGAVDIDGYLATADKPPVHLSTTSTGACPAITLAAQSPSHQVPRAPNEEVRLSIHNPPTVTDNHPTTSVSLEADATSWPSDEVPANGQQHERQVFQLHRLREGAEAGTSGSAGGGQSAGGSNGATPRGMQLPQDWLAAVAAVLQPPGDPPPAPQHHPAPPDGAPRVVMVGPKGVGKSTLVRFLVNRLLNHHPVVALMDCDCGQPEVTPPGVVSLTLVTHPLLGPPCTHIQPTHRSHYIGDTSPQSDPQAYSAALHSLLSWYWSDAAMQAATVAAEAAMQPAAASQPQPAQPPPPAGRPPLVVNTPGWVKGMGLELLDDLINQVGPTHVIQVRSRHEKRNPPPGLFWWHADPQHCPTHVYHVMSAAPHAATQPEPLLPQGASPARPAPAPQSGRSHTSLGAPAEEGDLVELDAELDVAIGDEAVGVVGAVAGGLSAADSRALQWHGWAKAAAGLDPRWGTYLATDLYQSAASLASAPPLTASLDHLQIHYMFSDPPADHLLGVALNGAVVGLATQPAEPSQSPLCHGVGLVRAVDLHRRLVYLLTSVSEAAMQEVDLLLVGRAAGELPGSLLHVGSLGAASPYLSLYGLSGVTGAAAGASGGKARRNVGRARLESAGV